MSRLIRWLGDVRFRLGAVLSRGRMQRDLDEEVAFHLEMEARKHRAEGMTPEEALRQAHISFGGEDRFKEEARASWGVRPLADFGGDVRFAARQLLKRPAFTGLASLTLALGIGGTVALFSVVNGLMLRPLPVDDEGRLVTFWSDYDWRGAEFDFVKERVQAYEGLAAYSSDGATMRGAEGARLVSTTVVSAELFDVLGTPPFLGRTFTTGEDRPGAEPVIVLSHGLWQREFAADRDILGRRIDLSGTLTTVVGVMPEGFNFPTPESEAFTLLNLDPDDRSYQSNGWLAIIGRLRAGSTDVDIEEDLARLATALGENWDYPDAWDKTRDPYVTPLREYLLGDVRPVLLLLLGAVGLVLLTACTNVTALLLTRTADRVGEMSVRTALGAGRARLARQVLTESVLLGIVAGTLGMLLAVAAFDVLVASLPLPSRFGDTLSLDWTALVASLLLAVVTGCLISLAPMHGLLRGDLADGVFGSRASSGTAGGGRVQHALVVGEVLLAVVLATGAALLVRTVGELRAVDAGLDPNGVMTVEVLLAEEGSTAAERARFFDALVERVGTLPGVESAGLIGRVPVRDGGWQGTLTLADRPDLTGPQSPNAYYRPVTPGTFDAFGIEIVEGRGILATDGSDDARVAVVNETFARSMFPGQSALGRVIGRFGSDDAIEIVGVIRNAAVDDLVGDVPMAAYYPWAQTLAGEPYAVLVAKTSLDPGDLIAPVRAAAQELDPRSALGRVESMDDVLNGAMAEPLRLRLFLGMFSLLGIVLGTVGVYGVVSYAVQRRRAEFGIRLALGAAPRRVLGDVARHGMLPVVTGVACGAVVAFVSSTALAGFVFGVEPTDPLSLAAACGALLVAGGLAALLPAWRASSTDPASALRAR